MSENKKSSTLEATLKAFTEFSGKDGINEKEKIRNLDLDSLDMVEIAMGIEKELDIEIPDEYMDRFNNVKYTENNQNYNLTIEDFAKELETYLNESNI